MYTHGLFLEGGRMNAELKLDESEPKVLFAPMTIVQLKPTPVADLSEYKHYEGPVYRTAARRGVLSTTGHSTNFVLNVELPSKEPCSGPFSKYCETFSAHWIKRSVALFCALNY